jgi:hypothetical protein
MTIKPDSTRLARARAFELRSNTCAMNPFLLPLRQKTTVEVDEFVFADERLRLKSAEIATAYSH